MEIRKLKDEDKAQAVELRKYSFDYYTDDEPTPEETADVIPEHSFGVFEGKRLVSLLRNYHLKQNVRGIIKSTNGIASVGSYPDSRYKGYVKKLMKTSFQYMKENNFSLSVLMPFKESFYANYGYVNATDKLMISIPLNSFSHYLKHKPDKNISFEIMKARDGLNIYKSFIKDIAVKYHGFLIFDGLEQDEWMRAVKNEIILLIKENGKIIALTKYKKKGFVQSGEIIVSDMYWNNLKARDLLFHYYARHIDQINNIVLPLISHNDIYQWTKDPMTEFHIKMWSNTWMVRIIELEKAISGLPSNNIAGEINIEIEDNVCEWNKGKYRIWSEGEELKITKSETEADIKADIKALNSLVYGTLTVEEVEHRNLLQTENKNNIQLLSQWFPTKPIYIQYDYRKSYL
jgi:predicted acetyltransferase